MNVLESLKIKDATVLNLKDGDILFVKMNEGTTESQIRNLNEDLSKELVARGYKDITLWIAENVSDVKIIRR